MNKFEKLGLTEPVLKALEKAKFTEPTEIQEKSIPLIVDGKDVIAGSATGSGKTLAFAAGVLKNSEIGYGVQSLILTPTRELAEQVSQALIKFSEYKRLKILSIYGGVSIVPQIRNLKSADIVVGTPGRILDHIERRTIDLKHVNTLVLDEADRMLDMGFLDDVLRIVKSCPPKRQTLLFSATISPDIFHIAKNYMKNPIEISAERSVDPKKLKQVYYDIQDNMKFSLLVHLLKHEKAELVMIFSNTRSNTDFVAENLQLNGVEAKAIHGGLTQDKRSKIMEQFHSNKVHVLVCTDVAARGLDISGVSHVYNYDMAKDTKEYIHRIGRTARAGKDGKVVNLISSRDYDNYSKVLRDNDLEIPIADTPKVEMVRIKFTRNTRRDGGDSRGRSGGGNGRRPQRGGSRGPSRDARRSQRSSGRRR